jgi:hypothetical protein
MKDNFEINKFRKSFNENKHKNSEIILKYLKDNKIDLDFKTSELTKHKLIFLNKFESFLKISELKREMLMWRSFFIPNSTYGHILGKSHDAILNLRENQPDLFCTDEYGILKNSIIYSDHKKRILDAKRNNIPVIFIFGGSTIMGQGAILPEFTIPSLIEKIYRKKFNQSNVCCINFGVGAWSSQESSKLFFNYAKNFNPELVIFYDGWNCANYFDYTFRLKDGENNFDGDGYRNSQHNYNLLREMNISYHLSKALKLIIFNLISFIHKYFKTNSFLDLKARSIVSKYIALQSANDVQDVLSKKKSNDSSVKFSSEKYLEIHSSIEKYLEINGSSMMTFLQPLIINSKKKLTKEEVEIKDNQDRDNEILIKNFYEQVSNNELKNFYNLKNVLNNTIDQTFLDLGHLNKDGNFIIAEYMADQIYEKIYNITNK